MLIKTEKGRHELRPGNRCLGQRERALLLVADGRHTESKIAELFSGEARPLLDRLLEQGYLRRGGTAGAVDSAVPAPSLAGPPQQADAVIHGEQFVGTRSLATARMFLFDLSERLFSPRDKTLASRYRDALREARDAEAMLAVGRAMIADVEIMAGSERANGISERLVKVLPAHLLETAA
jgi:hypothetical protein